MAEIEFELFNNQLVQQLVGPQDGNLKIIEKALGAEIAAFGNRIRISGDEEAVRQAKNAVDALYSKVSRGIAVGEQEVLAAVRISGAEANVKPQVNIDDIVLKTKKRHIYPRSATQAEYIVEMMNNELVFGLGPAGTGKTYLAVALAVTMMLEGSIDKIILSRPAVEAGENLGFLPGDLKDKVDPYLRPLYDALYEMLPAEQVDKKLAAGEIEIAPLAFMRGRTLSNAFVILDEAQNTTPMQMKMFLTRLGENSRMVVNGDLSQVDLPRGVVSGLRDALDTLRGVGGISSVTFSAADVVRHGLVAKIVRAYEQNTTPMQMKMFLTRLGENSRMVVNGDLSQVDLPRGVVSGLRDALDTLRGVGGISSVTFSAADVVRHGLVAKIVRAYEQKYHREEKKKDENDA